MMPSLTTVILAAGKGTRMKSAQPKAMQILAGKPLIAHLINSVSDLTDNILVVVGPDMVTLEKEVRPFQTVIQAERKGTGHAALIASDTFRGEGDVLVLYADNPLVTPETLKALVALHRQHKSSLTLTGMNLQNPAHYGRLIKNDEGTIERIVEYKDATPEERLITLCNAGMLCADALSLKKWLRQLTPGNAQNELYLTDIVAFAAKEGPVFCLEASPDELVGINSRAELAEAEHILQNRYRQKAMENGVTLQDPSSTYLSMDTRIESDVLIEPHVFIGPHVIIKEGAHIRAFSHLEGCTIEKNAVIGPYARLRPGTICEENAHVGNFVELKNTILGKKSKANHLTYLGDCNVGENTNIGAGTITCNYDGFFKHRTSIGSDSFIGSSTIMIAPITIGNCTITAAGSVLTDNVPDKAMVFGRARQVTLKDRGLAHQQALKTKKEQN